MTTMPLPAALVNDFGIPRYSADQMHAYAAQARTDLEAENQRLRKALGGCLAWMEELRACGDAGNWNWGEESEYMRGIAAMEKQP